MAKETGRTDSFHPVLAPLFALGQTTLEELDHQGERWLDYSAAQVAESFRVARGVRSQMINAAATLLATAGELAARTLDGAKAWTVPFTPSVATGAAKA
jgi:hypothetical protein